MGAMSLVNVYVPATENRFGIADGSGIVAASTAAGDLVAYYESNMNGAINLVTFADRVAVAAGRMVDAYPTVARVSVEAGALTLVGNYDTDRGRVILLDSGAEAAVAGWVGCAVEDLRVELESTSARHQMLREVEAARASGDPTRVFAANQMAGRYQLDG